MIPEESALGAPVTADAPTPRMVAEVVGEKGVAPAVSAAGPATNGPKPNARPQYSALSPGRRRSILGIVTAAGFFGPLAGNIYLPALPVLQADFRTSATVINATVSVFMGILAVAVCSYRSGSDGAWLIDKTNSRSFGALLPTMVAANHST